MAVRGGKWIALIVLLAVAGPRVGAQRTGGPAVVSPEVMPDRRVTFRLHAPQAKAVTVSGEWGGGRGR